MAPPARFPFPGPAELKGPDRGRRLELVLLQGIPGLTHAFTVRRSRPDAALRDAAGRVLPIHSLRQVHGTTVRRIADDSGDPPRTPPEGDALVTDRPGVALGVWVADCVPILVCDPRSRALAAVHAGWRGTAAGILRSVILALRQEFGARPEDLHVGLGPSIGPCCFEVGEEVVEALLAADPGATDCVRRGGGRQRVDLRAANRRQAIALGVFDRSVAAIDLCTACREDLFASYRRHRGTAERQAGLIAWSA